MTNYKFVLKVILEADNEKNADENFWDLACDGALNDFYTITETNEPETKRH